MDAQFFLPGGLTFSICRYQNTTTKYKELAVQEGLPPGMHSSGLNQTGGDFVMQRPLTMINKSEEFKMESNPQSPL
jgi:hypothetical protein